MTALLGIAAAVAALALVIRALQSGRASRLAPGGSAATAIPITQFDAIDATVGQQRCTCGGRFLPRGEGPVAANRNIRRVQIECRECGRARRIFFDLSAVHHALADG